MNNNQIEEQLNNHENEIKNLKRRVQKIEEAEDGITKVYNKFSDFINEIKDERKNLLVTNSKIEKIDESIKEVIIVLNQTSDLTEKFINKITLEDKKNKK